MCSVVRYDGGGRPRGGKDATRTFSHSEVGCWEVCLFPERRGWDVGGLLGDVSD